MKKSISKLFESELEKAEITLAIKDISDSLQKMASDISRMSVDEIPSVVERIKVTHGVAVGNDFGAKLSARLNDLTQEVLSAKSDIDDHALVISGDASQSDAPNAMDKEEVPMSDMDDEEPIDVKKPMDKKPDLDLFGKEMDEPRKIKEDKRILEAFTKKLSPKKKRIVQEMYKSGGKNRAKVLELAKKA
jgi:hypothetical protein